MVDRIRWDTVSYLPFYYVFFQFLLLTIFNLQANILTTKDILSNPSHKHMLPHYQDSVIHVFYLQHIDLPGITWWRLTKVALSSFGALTTAPFALSKRVQVRKDISGHLYPGPGTFYDVIWLVEYVVNLLLNCFLENCSVPRRNERRI